VSPNGSDRKSRRPMRRRLPQALAAGLVLMTATGCSASYKDFPRLGMPSPATEQAPRILSLWQGSWAAALATGVLVWGLILWSVIFHRRSRTKVEIPQQTRYNMPIEALYTVVPLVIVAVLFYFTARDENDLLKVSKKPDVIVNVVGYQWSWAFNYVVHVPGTPTTPVPLAPELSTIPKTALQGMPADANGVYVAGTPSEGTPSHPGPTLVLPKGETVKFVLTSRDVIHSFWIVPFLMKMDVIPGHTNVFQVTPDKTGLFYGKCAELCGVDHSRMLFNVRVVSPAQYNDFLKSLAKSGNTGYVPAGIATTGNTRDATTNEQPGVSTTGSDQ
jgi:cytochrome c oxidase subunit II